MKVTVTGGAGYIGSACVELLCDSGHDVLVIDNLTEGHRGAVDPRARLEVADLAETARLADLMREFGTDAVIHYAANALVAESMQNPSKYYRNNVAGGLSLLEAMVSAEVPKIVFSSTCATYGIPAELPITEATAQCPVNPYGHSKLVFEQILGWFGKTHGIASVIFRYFNAAGATKKFGEDHRVETHLIPNALFAALGKRDSLDIFGTDYDTPDGTAVRDYVHVCDLALIHQRAIEEPLEGTYNLGTGKGHSVREVIDVCRRVSGREIPARERSRRPGDPPTLIAAVDKAKREIGWNPGRTDLEETVRSAWAWHEAHPEGYGD